MAHRMHRPKRRRAALLIVAAAATSTTAIVYSLSTIRADQPTSPAPALESSVSPETSDPVLPAPSVRRLETFAVSRGVRLHLPAAPVRCVCYHEASYRDALALQPAGRMRRNYNPTKFPPDEPTTEGPDYLIMSSRGRGTPATSAADIVVPRGTELRSPVDGVVAKAKRYRLYGNSLDVRLTIRPDTSSDVRVVMIHVDDVRVRPGDRLEQGVTVLGTPRVLPISSQTDLYIPGRHPHVHVEIVDPERKP
jgi:hypothetical protein